MQYIKRQIAVEATRWTGDNLKEVRDFTKDTDKVIAVGIDSQLKLHTLNGYMSAHPGDYIIKTHRGEVYPCEEESFLEIYEPYGLQIDGDVDILQA